MTQPPRQPISDETLFGYILSAISQAESDEIESRLNWDSELRQRLASLRELLGPLDAAPVDVFEPAGDLVSRTMAQIDALDCHRGDQTDRAGTAPNSPSGLSSVVELATRQTRWAWIDSLAMVAAGITLLCVLLPSVWYSREESRRMACSQNLKRLGSALHEFASLNARGELPSIDIEGPLAFAGSYVLKLNESQLLESSNLVWCPTQLAAPRHLGVPSMRQYLVSTAEEQRSWMKTIGGSYAYHLGNIVHGKYETPRIASSLSSATLRERVPVMGDSVDLTVGENVTDAISHGSQISNLLYNDGRVQSIRLQKLEENLGVDHPYLNRHQARAVGIGEDDACLAPSFVPPVSPSEAWMISVPSR